MDWEDYRTWSARAADWAAGYIRSLPDQPVRSRTRPGDTLADLPAAPPENGESMESIFADFKRIIPPGLTHWQHPRMFAYFPANGSPPAALAEQLCAVIGINSMLWQTSPAATELEIRMIEWLRLMTGLPAGWRGTIQDTASTSSLVAIMAAREKALDWSGLSDGLAGKPQLRIYSTMHAHSSIAKAAALSGIGRSNAVQVSCAADGAMDPAALAAQINADRAAGMLPVAVVAVVGGTSIGVSDHLRPIGEIANSEGLFFHVDAAWAGSAMICPEFRYLNEGVELADSYVFNPHKWLGVQIECSAHFLKDPEPLLRTMEARPAYLRTSSDGQIDNFSEWSVSLGRRFRALKLWFAIRSRGVSGMREMIRNHVAWAAEAAVLLRAAPGFEITSEPALGLFSFRHMPKPDMLLEQANEHNAALLESINAAGATCLTQTMIDGKYVIRMCVGQTDTTLEDVRQAVASVIECASSTRP